MMAMFLKCIYNFLIFDVCFAAKQNMHAWTYTINIANVVFTESTLLQNDVVCQRELTQVSASWQPFEDPETKIIRCIIYILCLIYSLY